MKPVPRITALANSIGIPGNAKGSAAPRVIAAVPINIGRRTPARSEKRPAEMAKIIGSSA